MENVCTIDSYIDSKIDQLRREGRGVTADNYRKAKACLHRYCPNDQLTFQDITEEFVEGFNRFLEKSHIQKATLSFYNRVLRSIYNQAAKEGIVKNIHPFDGAYTKVVTKPVPIRTVISDTGETVSLNDLSKEELFRRYCTVITKYNTLVSKLSVIMGV